MGGVKGSHRISVLDFGLLVIGAKGGHPETYAIALVNLMTSTSDTHGELR